MAELSNAIEILGGLHNQQDAIAAAETLRIAGIDLMQYCSTLSKYGVKPTGKDTFIVRHMLYTAADLEQMNPQPPDFIIGGLLPVGLTIFAAPSKFGKSWACIDMCAAVAQGRPFWGLPTQQHGVLYLDLESSANRLMQRMKRLETGFPANMRITHACNDLDHGLLEELAGDLDANPDIKLVVIDTIGRVKGGSRRGEDAYTADTRIYGGLQRLAQSRQIAIICVTHTRKGVNIDGYDDPFAAMQGSAGIMGVSDCTWMIVGKRDADEKRFLATGRDINDQDYTITFNADTCKWSFIGTTDALEEAREREEWESNPIRRTILKLLAAESYCIRSKPEFFEDVLRETNKAFDSPTQLAKEARKIAGKLLEEDRIAIEDAGVWPNKGRCLRFSKKSV